VLQTVSFPERHTGVNIADKLKEIAKRWEILCYALTVSHDQVSNMEAAMHILIEEYSWQSLPCSAHRLQLCILAGLSISAIDRLSTYCITLSSGAMIGHVKINYRPETQGCQWQI